MVFTLIGKYAVVCILLQKIRKEWEKDMAKSTGPFSPLDTVVLDLYMNYIILIMVLMYSVDQHMSQS